jgi:hypothetical protein
MLDRVPTQGSDGEALIFRDSRAGHRHAALLNGVEPPTTAAARVLHASRLKSINCREGI